MEVKPVKVGDPVGVVDESYIAHTGLVTAVHGSFFMYDPETKQFTDERSAFIPCINVAYVSADPSKHDPYGQQLERLSSLQHYDQGPSQMPTAGRYWVNLDEEHTPA